MEYIVSSIWIVLEMLGLFFACKAFLSQRIENRYTLIYFSIAGALIFSISNFQVLPLDNMYFKKGITFAICFVVSSINFRGSWYSRLITISLYYFGLGAMDTIMIYGTTTFLGIAVADLVWKKWLYTVVVTTGKCLLLFTAWVLCYFRRKKGNPNLSGKRLLLVTLFPFVSIVMLYTVFDSYSSQEDLSISAVVFSMILVVANIAIIYLTVSLERATRAEQEVALLNQSMALQTENIQSLEKSYRAQRTATHEFKHQLQVIHDLLENGDGAEAMSYIEQLQINQTSRIFAVSTNHPIVDAILNEKYRAAKKSQIDINYRVNDLSNLTIGTDAIVVLLSNLLDNAIEACQRFPGDKMIECTLLLEDGLFLSIRNTSLPVSIVDGEIKTVKEPPTEHGFGLAGVRRILKQLNGEYAIDYAGNWFQFVAEVPIE